MLVASNGKLHFISCLLVPVFMAYHETADLRAVILVSCSKETSWNFQSKTTQGMKARFYNLQASKF